MALLTMLREKNGLSLQGWFFLGEAEKDVVDYVELLIFIWARFRVGGLSSPTAQGVCQRQRPFSV